MRTHTQRVNTHMTGANCAWTSTGYARTHCKCAFCEWIPANARTLQGGLSKCVYAGVLNLLHAYTVCGS